MICHEFHHQWWVESFFIYVWKWMESDEWIVFGLVSAEPFILGRMPSTHDVQCYVYVQWRFLLSLATIKHGNGVKWPQDDGVWPNWSILANLPPILVTVVAIHPPSTPSHTTSTQQSYHYNPQQWFTPSNTNPRNTPLTPPRAHSLWIDTPVPSPPPPQFHYIYSTPDFRW